MRLDLPTFPGIAEAGLKDGVFFDTCRGGVEYAV